MVLKQLNNQIKVRNEPNLIQGKLIPRIRKLLQCLQSFHQRSTLCSQKDPLLPSERSIIKKRDSEVNRDNETN